jgi:hypothetical protein
MGQTGAQAARLLMADNSCQQVTCCCKCLMTDPETAASQQADQLLWLIVGDMGSNAWPLQPVQANISGWLRQSFLPHNNRPAAICKQSELPHSWCCFCVLPR